MIYFSSLFLFFKKTQEFLVLEKECWIHKHATLQKDVIAKGYQMLWTSLLVMRQMLFFVIYYRFPLFKHGDETLLCTAALYKTTLTPW